MNAQNIVVLRPGALGDVFVCRHLMEALKAAFPEARRVFVAPGERGRMFGPGPGRFGLADVTADWENAAFAWLFSADADAKSAPSALLREVFAPGGATLVLAYLDLGEEEGRKFRERLAALAVPADSATNAVHAAPTRFFLFPSRPPDGAGVYIGRWLVRNALAVCGAATAGSDFPADADLIVDAEPDASALVIHPGSGGVKKNWPLASFAALAGLLAAEGAGTGLTRIRIVAGEADCGQGERLAAMLPGAELVLRPTLVALAGILASAALYVGNDSGVTHVAAAARARAGGKPKVAAVFGPSDPAVWAAPGTLALRAGEGMDGLSPKTAFLQIRQGFFS